MSERQNPTLRGSYVSETDGALSVAFLMEYVPVYRASFYECLAEELSQRSIEFRLCVGDPAPPRAPRNDAVIPPGAVFHKSRFLSIRGRQLKLQFFPKEARTADLLVVQQEAGNLVNYLLAIRARFGRSFAVWGHGEDPFEEQRSEFSERLKGLFTRQASWAFAYTKRSKQGFEAHGMASDKITVVNNSMRIETTFEPDRVDPELLELVTAVKTRSKNVGWYVSSMHKAKRLTELTQTVQLVRDSVEDFEFFFIGEGEGRGEITDFCRLRPWAHDLGTRRGDDKAAVGSAARLMIMPGTVGLHVLDAFAFGTPLVASTGPSNSHELDYLETGVNGVLLEEGARPVDFARAVIELLSDPGRHEAMCAAGVVRSRDISVEAMAERFADGIVDALATAQRE